jgi:HAD superfamily hydrolase (TIGR01484 family)
MSAGRPKALKAYGVLSDADRVIELGNLGSWRPKLVATDLDGTLLNAAGEVSPRTRAALEACWDAGIAVVGVTGRGPRLLDSVRAALDARGIAVLAQGGFVVDLERDEVLRTVGLPRNQAQAVIERIEDVAGDLIVAVEEAAE